MHIRPYQGSDESELLKLWHATMTHDRIGEDVFRAKVLLDPNFRAENLPVAVEDNRLVGFVLALTRQVPFFGQGLEPDKAWITAFGVHPDYRCRGIGTALFNMLIERLRYEDRRTLDISPYVPNYFAPGVDVDAYPGTVAFLQNKFGFTEIERPISMGANLSGFQIPPDMLELERRREQEDGVTIQPVASADLPDLMPFIAQYFGWDWRRHAGDYLQEYFGDSPNQICFLVARKQGEVVGFCQQRRERFGPFGVHPDYRNLQIGRLLLFRCLETMSAKQVYFAYFMWTGEDAARLYTRAGFQKRREFSVLRKIL